MIRRDPTLIPMTDNDVQDIRDMVAARLKKAEAKQQDASVSTSASTAGMSNPGASVPGFAAQEEAKIKKEAMSRNERLGL